MEPTPGRRETNFYSLWPNTVGAFQFSQNIGGSSYLDLMTIYGNGNVGIGTTTPNYKLDVNNGFFRTWSNTTTPPSQDTGLIIGWNRSGGYGETNFYNAYAGAPTSFEFKQNTGGSNYSDLMTLYSSGIVAIGVTAPNNGGISRSARAA